MPTEQSTQESQHTGRLSAFPYVGGKSELAPWVIENLPPHECYVEPFGGSASVLINKPRSTVEVLNDLDGDVVHFFEVCRDRADELAEFVRDVPYSRELYNEWRDGYYNGERPDDPVERAGRWVLLRYASFGGKYGRKCGFKRASHLNAQPPSKIWEQVPERVDALRHRLRGVEIECLGYDDILERYDSDGTVFYLDPPYLECDPDYYQESAMDHADLHRRLEKIDGRCIVSYAEVPEFYHSRDWWILQRDYTQRARRGSTGEWNDKQTESLICNFDTDETPSFVDANTDQATLGSVVEC